MGLIVGLIGLGLNGGLSLARGGFTSQQVGEILAGSTMIAMFGGIAATLAALPGFERMWAVVGVAIGQDHSEGLIAAAAESAFALMSVGGRCSLVRSLAP